MSCAAILVGGSGQRMGGVDKWRLVVDGTAVLERQLAVLSSRFDLIFAVGGASEPWVAGPLRHVEDYVVGSGPLAGIAAALDACPDTHCFVVACDMPYLSGPVIDAMAQQIGADPSLDVLVCADENGRIHPLHGFYSKHALGPIRRRIDGGHLAATAVADPSSPVATSLSRELFEPGLQKTLDPTLRFLHNVNRPSDLQANDLS